MVTLLAHIFVKKSKEVIVSGVVYPRECVGIIAIILRDVTFLFCNPIFFFFVAGLLNTHGEDDGG